MLCGSAVVLVARSVLIRMALVFWRRLWSSTVRLRRRPPTDGPSSEAAGPQLLCLPTLCRLPPDCVVRASVLSSDSSSTVLSVRLSCPPTPPRLSPDCLSTLFPSVRPFSSVAVGHLPVTQFCLQYCLLSVRLLLNFGLMSNTFRLLPSCSS